MRVKNKNIKIFPAIIAFCALAVLSFSHPVSAQPVRQLDVSAYIINQKNEEIANGKYSIRFAIYLGNEKLWEETQEVEIANGILNAYLGSRNPLPDSLRFDESDYYLGIKIGTDSEMTPRKKIGAVPLAVNSSYLSGAALGTEEGDIPQLGKGGKLDKKLLPKITDLGIVSTGTWEGNAISDSYVAALMNASHGDILYHNGVSWAKLSAGISGQYLETTGPGSNPRWSTVTTHDKVSLSGAYDYLTLSEQEIALGQIDLTTDVTGILPTAWGGTGLSSYATGDMLYYSSGTAFSKLAIGLNGQVLSISGGVPTWTSTAPSAPHNILSVQHNDTTPGTVVRGDLITGQGATPTWSRLALGTLGYFLKSDGTDVIWAQPTKSDVGLSNVENTALSTWAGSANITTLGTIGNGVWNGTSISPQYGGTGLSSIGIANQILGINAGATGLEYKSIFGTANQIAVTHGVGNITLSSPQDIAVTSSPTFAGLTLSGNLNLGANTLVTSNTTLVANLNADMLDGQHGSYYAPLSNISGAAGYLAKFTNSNVVGNSVIYDDGTNVGIGTANPTLPLRVLGTASNQGGTIDGAYNAYAGFGNVMVGQGATTGHAIISPIGSGQDLVLATFVGGVPYDRVRILNNGNVGIGTTGPSALLNLKGTLSSVLTGTVAVTNLSTTVTGTGTAFTTELAVGDSIKIGSEVFTVSAIASATSLTLDSAYQGSTASGLTAYRDPTLFAVDNGDAVNKLTITRSGNVGIGTTAPSAHLHIKSASSAINPMIKLENDLGDVAHFYVGRSAGGSSGNLFLTAPTGKNVIFDVGNVGIGTTSPSELLHIYKSTGWSHIRIETDGTSNSGSQLELNTPDGAGVIGIRNDGTFGASSNLGFRVGATNAMVITNNGNVGIGTTTPGTLLHINNPADSDFFTISQGADYKHTFYNYFSGTNSRLDFKIASGVGTQVNVMTLQGSGNVGIGTTAPGYKLQVGASGDGSSAIANAWNVFSDARYKENINDIGNALGIVKQIRGVGYDWKTSKIHTLGFIAQEVEQVLPELVSTDANGYKSMDYSKLTPILVEAVKEQQSQISGVTLKTDQNIATVSELQSSVDQQLGVVEKQFAIYNQQFADINKKVAELPTEFGEQDARIAALETLAQTLQAQVAELQAQVATPVNVAQIDLNTQDIAFLKQLLGISRVSDPADIDLLGKFSAEVVESGALVIEVKNDAERTVGEAAILAVKTDADADGIDDATGSDGKTVRVKTTAANANSKIFVTSKTVTDVPLAVTKINDGESFVVEVKSPVTEDFKFDWIIIEER